MNLNQDVFQIVEKTLSLLEVNDITWVKLICGTMAIETGLRELFDADADCFGFSMMTRDVIKDTIKSYLNPNIKLHERIIKATGVDLRSHTIPEVLNFLKSNIALQTALTYYAYQNSYLVDVNDTLDSLAGNYADKWLGCSTETKESAKQDFKNAYKETFGTK